jgi:probable HAF family extracellular repeat protein
MRLALKIGLGVFLFALLSNAANAVPQSLNMMPPGSGQTIANDMNTAGQVAGIFEDPDGLRHGIYFEKGKPIQLGTLGGKESEASRINDKGVVVGSTNLQSGKWHAFTYSRVDGMQDLGTLGGDNSHGSAINNDGTVVGYSDTLNDDWHAFLYQPGGVMKDLGTLGGKISYANAINNKGQVVGVADINAGGRHAFLYDAEHGMTDIGTLGGRHSTATAVNDSGVVVGSAETADRHWHAFVFDGKRMLDLGKLIGAGDSYANAINSAGHVVGVADIGDYRVSFVWRDGKMTLHPSGKGLYLTNAINDSEQVVGATLDRSGYDAAMMISNAVPYVDRGGLNLFMLCASVIIASIVAVVLRKRYRGILMYGFVARRRGWGNW